MAAEHGSSAYSVVPHISFGSSKATRPTFGQRSNNKNRFADKAPLDKACFDRTKLAPGYNDCGADGCYVKKLDADQWYRTDEVNVTVP